MAFTPPKAPLIAIIGATGTGKSKLAVELALRYDGEIINGDAMQMYQGLPIITNKLPVDERRGVPHHLLGCVGLDEETWTVNKFVKEGAKIVDEIRSRGRLPILVGGTHYYTDALLLKESLLTAAATAAAAPCEDGSAAAAAAAADDDDDGGSGGGGGGMSEGPKRWPILEASTTEIYAKLKEVDPAMASRWHPNDRTKISRSLEIWLQTGRRASEIYEAQKQQQQQQQPRGAVAEGPEIPQTENIDAANDKDPRMRYSSLVFWLHARDDVLKARLNGRVHDMLAAGLVSEARLLDTFKLDQESKGNSLDITRGIWISIGYKELQPYLSAMGHASSSSDDDEVKTREREMCIEAIQAATRQYAKRQERWIRNRSTNALLDAGAREKLFLLDATHLSEWNAAVTEPSRTVVNAFLAGRSLPEPTELSPAALFILPGAEGPNQGRQTFLCRTCEMCNKIMVTDEQWEGHLKGRAHRRVLQAKAKRERDVAYLSQFIRTEHDATT